MKKFTKVICVIMTLVLLLAVPVHAQEDSARSSAYILSYDSFLWKTSDTQFQVWFDITGMGEMEELGVSLIRVQRRVSPNDEWVTVKSYYPTTYPQMIKENSSGYCHYVTYTGATGYYYRAIVTFYAKNSTGYGKNLDYAETIYM